MADDEIKIVISAQDNASPAIKAAGKTVEDMAGRSTRATEAARLGFWTMGEAAENSAQAMGVPNQMSRQLGNAVEGLASKLGGGAMAFGLVGLAAGAAYAIFQQYKEGQRKLQEETLKSADASMKWVEAAKINTKETNALAAAKDRLFQIEKEQNILALERGIQEQSKLIMKQYDELEKLGKRSKTGGSGGTLLGRLLFGSKEEREKEFQDMGFEARKTYEKLLIMQEQYEIAKGNGTLRRGGKNGVDEVKYIEGEKLDAHIEAYKYQLEFDEEFANAEARIAEARYQNEVNLQMRLRNAQKQALDNTEGFLKMTADMHGKHGRAAFSAYKAVATARALIATYQSAVEAFKTGSEVSVYLGAAYAAAAVAYGMAQVRQIRSQSYDGGGGGAVGTFSANPNTGLPTSSSGSGSSVNLRLVINGSERSIGDITSGVMQTLYNNNGGMDGFNVLIERSA